MYLHRMARRSPENTDVVNYRIKPHCRVASKSFIDRVYQRDYEFVISMSKKKVQWQLHHWTLIEAIG
jgi:hypothetical protein